MPFTRVAHGISTNGGTGTASIAAVDTSGAALLVLIADSSGSGVTPTDSKGNTWTRAAHANNGSVSCDIWYCTTPTVGAGHTFSLTASAPSLAMLAYSRSGTITLDQTNVATSGAVGSLATGSVTPSVDNELLVAGVLVASVDVSSVDSSFTLVDHIAGDGATVFGTGSAEQIQTNATTRNPTFTFTGPSGGNTTAAIATFRSVMPSMFLVF